MTIDDEEALLRSAALQNVQSIQSARQRAEQELLETKEALEEETRILELLNSTGATLASSLDLRSVVQTVTDAGTALSGAEYGAFFHAVHDAEGDRLTFFALAGARPEAFAGLGPVRVTPLLAPTFHGRGVVRIADVREDPRYGQLGPNFGMPPGHLPVRSYLAVPVVTRSGEVVGGLFFGHGERDMFTPRAERLIVGIAAQAAIAIDNARLYEEATRSAAERASLLDAERVARAEVERISLLKDEFLSTLSHELRTPLNAIMGWSQVLLARAPHDSATRQGLHTIARNARAQAQLVDDLLDMNRIVSGKIRLDVQRLDLVPVIEAALDSVRPSADAKAITIQTDMSSAMEPLLGDPNRLQQIAWNLLSNAVKFSTRGGRIEVRVSADDVQAELVVRDTGIGIQPEFLPHIFERFRQADASTTRKYGGLGLGLSIVKQLVELHGGSVKADSVGLGQGTTFTVSLPLRAAPANSNWPREPTTAERPLDPALIKVSLAGLKVLVVDDERDARELLRNLLSDAAAMVVTAASAEEGIEQLKLMLPDVIVSDIGMPERDGYHFIRDVRTLGPEQGGKTPAIALTAFARSEDRTRAMLAGYQIHMSKPVEPRELLAAIRSLAVNRGSIE